MLLILFLISFAQAASHDTSCGTMKDHHEFFHCSIQKHPGLTISTLKNQEGQAILERAGQWKNPELDVKSVAGENAGEKNGSTEVVLAIPISQLWDRPIEKEIGRAEKTLAEIEAKVNLANIKREMIKDLYRLRQIEEELDLIHETVDAFKKIQSQFSGRLVRGAEQEITLNLVELATGDYGLKENHLLVEKLEILARLKTIWGSDFKVQKEYLPPLKEKWPEIKADTNAIPFDTQRRIAESDRAKAEERLTSNEIWDQMKLGPAATRTTDGANQFWSVGFSFSMGLPIFTQNGGGRRMAEARSNQTRLWADYGKRKATLDQDILIQKYKSSVESLRKSSSRDALRKRHDKIDALFRRGLAGGSIMIEAHRQIIEFTMAQHEHEMTALDSFIEFKSITGDDVEEILK